MSSATAEPPIPLALPGLPSATDLPWPAEIVEAHRGLASAFRTSRAALNLDESDPVRLGHHVRQAETFMVSIVDVLGNQTANPLPQEYIETLSGMVSLLVSGLRLALIKSTTVSVLFPKTVRATQLIYLS